MYCDSYGDALFWNVSWHLDVFLAGCKSSGSEVERSDNEAEDEGFDDSSIDPKLLAKLKKVLLCNF